MQKICLLLFLLSSLKIYSQTGPGGVGNSDGSGGQPENIVWYDASSLSLGNNTAVPSWSDLSGNANHALQSNSGLQPLYRTNQINGLSAVYFDGSEYLSVSDADNLDNTTGITVIVVAKPATIDGNPRGLISKRNDSGDQEAYYLFTHTSSYLYFNAGTQRIDGNVAATADAQIFSATFDGSISNPRSKVYNDGDESGSGNGPTSIGDMSSDLHIGILNPVYAQGFDGDIAEAIVFRDALNDAQLQIINQYINVKYGITISNDYFSPNASYVSGIAGIGEEANGEHALTTSDGLYLEALSGLNSGDYLFASHNNSANDTTSYTTDDVTGSVVRRYNRIWYLEKTNTPAARLSFDFSEASTDAQNPVNPSNYVLLFRSSLTGNFSVVKNADGVQNGDQVYFVLSDSDIDNGYYTLGTEDEVDSPLKGAEGRTWYTLISGNWENWEVWTLDPSGALPNNPDHLTPTTSPTSNADNVVILTGKTVTVNSDNKENNIITIDGRLDFQSTSGHSFGEIQGRGRILLSDDNFPGGDATHFISEGQGEGTVEYYGTSFTLNQSLEFYDMVVDMDAAVQTLTLLTDYTINGNFRIKQGEFQINNDASTTNLNISVTGDVNIESNGKILTGDVDARHQLNLYGDFTNEGTAEFTNRSSADYNNEAIDGIVDVNFLSDIKDQTASCNGTTNFYRIEIDKGTDDTYKLVLQASNSSNFNLFGYANENHGSTAQLTDNNNALGLIKGTVQIKNNVSIPVLSIATNYNISEAARLWVDGGSVIKPSGNALVPYGKILVSAGTLETGSTVSSGITTRGNALVKIEGGTLTINQLRTSIFGAENVGGYVQTGGTTNIMGGSTSSDYYCFNLTYPGNVFNMSGGTLHIHEAEGKGGIFINSDVTNQNVTGGTVIFEISDGNDFPITSTAPFWNVILRNSSSGTGDHILTEGVDVSSTDVDLAAQPLKVLNDLIIEGYDDNINKANHPSMSSAARLDAATDATNVSDVYVGGSFFIGDNASYNSLEQNSNPAYANVTYFNQTNGTSAVDSFYVGNGPYVDIAGLTIDRTTGNAVRVTNDNNTNSIQLRVRQDLEVLSGTLDQNKFTVQAFNSVKNYDRLGTYYSSGSYPVSGGTPDDAQIRMLVDDIEVDDDGAIFGNAQINANPNNPIEFVGDVIIERFDHQEGVIYIGSNNLTINHYHSIGTNNYRAATTPTYDDATETFIESPAVSSYLRVVDMGRFDNGQPSDGDQRILIITDGNASDGGLSLKVSQNTLSGTSGASQNYDNLNQLTFPIGYTTSPGNPDVIGAGVNTYYRPAQVKITDFSDDGYITIRPVSGELQTTDLTGGEILQHYWRVTHSGFSTLPKVAYRFYYRNREEAGIADLPSGASLEASYVPGKVEDSGLYNRFYESNAVGEEDTDAIFNAPVDSDTRVIIFNGNNTGTTYDDEFDFDNSSGFELESANYTAGEADRFVGAPTVYYSRAVDGNWWEWQETNHWSTDQVNKHIGAPAGSYPGVGDVVVVGSDYVNQLTGGSYSQTGVGRHQIRIDGTVGDIEVAEIVFDSQAGGTALVVTDMSRVYVRAGITLDASVISGKGEMVQDAGPNLANFGTINADLGSFVNDPDNGWFFWLQANGETVISDRFKFPNMRPFGGVSPGQRSITFSDDIEATSIVIDNYVTLSVQNNITCSGQLLLGSNQEGYIEFADVGVDKIFEVGSVTMAGGADSDENSITVENTGTDIHTFRVNGDITFTNGNTFDLTSASGSNVILELTGDENSSFSNATAINPALYKIKMNKGTSQTTTFTFNDDFTLNGPTSGAGVEKALTMENGTLILDDADIDIDLTTGDDDFYIPASAGFEILQGQVNASGGSGILLDGKLQISGGTVDMSGGDNYIQYSSSGNATLEISDGDLIVGSHIRRGLTSGEGILKYSQSGGNVIVGNDAAPENNRGVFEIVNPGSEFNHTGGNLIVGMAQNNPTIASLYLDPENYSFSESTNIQFGYTNTPAGDAMSIYATISLPNIKLDNTSGSNHTLKQLTVPLTITDSLEIDAGTTYDANGLDLTLQGDLIVNGNFTANSNTTIFNSTSDQQIVGSPVFYKLTKNASGTLYLNDDITIGNEFNATSGVIADNSNDIIVMGNVYFDATHQWGGAGNGILLEGTSTQNLYSSGTLGKLSINNSEGIFVPEGYNVFIDDALQLESGVLNIGKNLIELDTDAVIIEANTFSENNMIQTNLSFTDAGVKKFFPTIVPADNFNFTYPIGSEGKYTPVSFAISQMGSGGYIRVKAANEMHPTILNDDEPCKEIHDTSNVLKYHWLLEASGASNFTGNVNMKYYNQDFQLDNSKTGTSYTVSDYITARLLLGSSSWNKYGPDSFDENNQLLTFSFTNTNDDGISGEYTAGIEDQGGTCEGAIPDEVPAFISINDGDWTDALIWDTYPVSGGSVPINGPRGTIVIIEDHVTIPQNYIVSYKTTINTGGLLDIGTTFGHRLGVVDGLGTLKLERGNLPAGVYNDFFGTSGGTIEFAGDADYDVLSEVNNVRNIKFSGTGERRLPNLGFEVYGLFTIAGDDATLEVINEHDRNITLDSNVVFTHGSFDAGVGTSKVIMNGTSNQTITGDFTGSNAFWNFEMNNSSGITLAGDVEIDRILTFSSGIITTSAANMLTINNTSETAVLNYNSSKYVDGPLSKKIISGDDFIFPVGDNSRYGQLVLNSVSSTSTDYWEAEYYHANPHPTYDTSSYASPLTMVSGNEYWRVKGPEATSTSPVTIRWDNQSILPAMSDDRANDLHIAQWFGNPDDEWRNVGNVLTNGSVNEGTLKTTSAVTLQEHYFTLASEESAPVATATFTSNDTSICEGESVTLSIDLTGNPDWTVIIEEGGDSVTFSGQSTSPLTFNVDSSGTYTIAAVSDNNGGGSVFGPDVTVTVVSIPTLFNVTGGGTICSGELGPEVSLNGSEIGVDYELYVDGSPAGSIVAGDGGAISFGNQTADGNYTVKARDASAICAQIKMTGSVDVNVNPAPTAILTVDALLDTICDGGNTEIDINFTGAAPYTFTISDGTDTYNGTSGDDVPYVPAGNMVPVWVNDGTPQTDYTYTITTITDANGCTNTNQGSAEVVVFKVPQTGPQYHITNDWNL